jgi:pyruvate carboxylase
MSKAIIFNAPHAAHIKVLQGNEVAKRGQGVVRHRTIHAQGKALQCRQILKVN